MRISLLLLGATTLSILVSPQALAQSRYEERPPVLVSPDLTAPWVMQLERPRRGQISRYQVEDQPQRYETRPALEPRRISKAKALAPTTRQQAQQTRKSEQRPGNVQTASFKKLPRDIAKPALSGKFMPQTVAYSGPHKPGTIIIDTNERLLYLVEKNGQAKRFGVGVGKPGFEWAGKHKVTAKREWPDWRPPASMIAREKKKGRIIPAHMQGGIDNPLGARALYLGSTLYRIHGTNAPWTIGGAVSSGCIRMRNEDVEELYRLVPVGATVIVK